MPWHREKQREGKEKREKKKGKNAKSSNCWQIWWKVSELPLLSLSFSLLSFFFFFVFPLLNHFSKESDVGEINDLSICSGDYIRLLFFIIDRTQQLFEEEEEDNWSQMKWPFRLAQWILSDEKGVSKAEFFSSSLPLCLSLFSLFISSCLSSLSLSLSFHSSLRFVRRGQISYWSIDEHMPLFNLHIRLYDTYFNHLRWHWPDFTSRWIELIIIVIINNSNNEIAFYLHHFSILMEKPLCWNS